MAKEKAVAVKDDEAPKVPMKAMVTYHPGPHDPPETKWWGYLFRANVPKEISHPQLLASVPGNPFFSLDGKKFEKKAMDAPTSPEDYRAWATDWIKASTSHQEMTRKWEMEQDLRDEIGVGSDDLDLILPFYNRRYEQLKKAAMADA